jgi:hypothetical protein
MGGDRCGFLAWGGGKKRGGAHGAVAREEGEAALGRREEEEGRVAAWAGRPNVKEKNFRIKNWIFQFTKALENCGRRFRRNFDMRIFPKFF